MQSIIAEKRDVLGKKVKNLRKQGFLPAVLYGKGKAATPLALREVDFVKFWKSVGESSVAELKVGKETNNVLIQDVALDPLNNKPIHADFYAVEMDKPIKVDVALRFVGESEAVKSGGVLVKALHEIKIEALPKDLPHDIEVDISLLKTFEDSIKVKDVSIPKNVAVLDNPEDTVALAEPPRSEEETKTETAAPSLEAIEVVGKKPKAEGGDVAASEEKDEKAENKEKTAKEKKEKKG